MTAGLVADSTRMNASLMPDKVNKRRVSCDPEAHKLHLCYLIAHRRMAKARSLVGNGRFRCGVCDRVAEGSESLCDPIDRAKR